jgi:hypothetical protein
MAFFKEKRTGNLGTVTAVDWGRSIGQSLNYDALNKYYQRKFDQKVRDLELTPQVFETTLSFLEPKIQSKVLELQNEYKSNADISYRKSDFSDAAINARQRNVEILKELKNMEAGIQSLEEAEAEFANNPDAFFPHEINTKLGPRETKLRAAYTELINGDYKTGKADEVLDVYFKNGKTMVTIDGIGDVELNDLRPYDQPREGLYSEFTNQLSAIATTATTNTAEANALLTKILGSIDNDLNYSDIQDLLDFQITISPQFTGDKLPFSAGTLRIQNDQAYRDLFEKLVKNANATDEDGNPIYADNWHGFFNPEIREALGMELNAGVEQEDIVQGIEGFVRGFVERVGNQFITAGKKIQDDVRQQELDDYLNKITEGNKLKLGNKDRRIAAGLEKLKATVLANIAEDGNNAERFFQTQIVDGQKVLVLDKKLPVLRTDLSDADLSEYNKIYMEEFIRQGGNPKGSVNTYDEAKDYVFRVDRENLINTVNAQIDVSSAKLGEKGRQKLKQIFEVLETDDFKNPSYYRTNDAYEIIELGEEDGIKYFQFTDYFVTLLERSNLIGAGIGDSVRQELLNKKIFVTGKNKGNAAVVELLRDIAFNRFVAGTNVLNKSDIFTIDADSGKITAHTGNATTSAGRINLTKSMLKANFIDSQIASVLGVTDEEVTVNPLLNVPTG